MQQEPNKTTFLESIWQQCKVTNPYCICLVRRSDFYETLGDDAIIIANQVGVILSRIADSNGGMVPITGFPFHRLSASLEALSRAGVNCCLIYPK